MNTKIIFSCHGIGNGGAERVISTLANEFAKRGYAVALLVTMPDNNNYAMDERIRVYHCVSKKRNAVSRTVDRIKKIRRSIKDYPPDAIISFSSITNIQVLIASIGIMGVKKIVSERTDPSRYPTSIMGKALRSLTYLMADTVVFQTEDARQYFNKLIRKKSAIILNPVCLSIRQRLNVQKERRIVGVGSLCEQKNWKMAIDAFIMFKTDHSGYIFEIYGIGEDEKMLLDYIESKQLTGEVILKGFSKTIQEDICSASMYVSSSIYEGISNSMLEAMAIGVPVICTDCPVGGARMVIDDGINGLLVPVNDINAMSEAMGKIADSSELAESLSKNSIRIAKELSLPRIVDKWMALL